MKSIFSLPEWQQAILSGVLLGIAFQPWHLGWLAWIGFIPLFHIWLHGNVKDNFKLNMRDIADNNKIELDIDLIDYKNHGIYNNIRINLKNTSV